MRLESPAAPVDRTGMASAPAVDEKFFLQRLRTAFWVIVAGTAVTTVADLRRPESAELVRILAIKAALLGTLGSLVWALRFRWVREHPELMGLLGVTLTALAGTANGIIRGDAATTVVLLAMIALAAIVVLPWGLGPQTTTAVITAACMATAVLAIAARHPGGIGGSLRSGAEALGTPTMSYAGATMVIALAVLLYVAREFARYRRTIERANRELREAERFARATVDALSADVAILDGAGIVVGVNQAWQERDPSEGVIAGGVASGTRYLELCTTRPGNGAAPARQLAEGIRAMLASGCRDFTMEYSAGSGATERWFAIALTRFRGRGPVRLVLTQTEVTARRRAEIELRQAKEAAEVANRAKGDFLANMSHEVRTPMHAVIGLTDIVLESELTGEQRKDLSSVRAAAVALLAVIDDVLDFSQIEAGKLQLASLEFDLEEQVAATLRTLEARAQGKGLELRYEIDPALPHTVVGDAARVGQILVNLVGNAIKFTQRGGITVRVDVASRTAAAVRVVLAVADTGIGIPTAKQAVIFERFEQVDGSSTRRYGGSGLGLSIVKQLVEIMGGEISVESELDRGSVFRVELSFPLAASAGAADAAVAR